MNADTTPTATAHRVVILGAGYAGLTAASRLAREVDADAVSITLVNAVPEFVERPRLHQVASGQDVGTHPLAELLRGTHVQLKLGWARAVDTEARTVTVSTEDSVEDVAYDTLVYALGSTVDNDTVPGIREHAHVLGDVAASGRLRAALPEHGTVVVAGGGMTGIEAAAEFAEQHPGLTVRLVSRGEPGEWLSPAAKRYLDRALSRLGVEVVSGVEIAEIADGRLLGRDASGEVVFPFDVCLWAGGFTVPALAAESGFEVDRAGRVIVDDHLRSVSHPDVYVIGDAAALAGTWGAALAYGCRVAGFMGPYAADAIAAGLAGKDAPAFRFRYIHQNISLGRKDAVVQFVHAGDESPRNAVLRGRVAVWYKDLVLGSAVWLFRNPGPYLPHRRVRPVAQNAGIAAAQS